MRQERTNKANRALCAAAVLLCLAVGSGWLLKGVHARYITGALAGEQARAASFQVTADVSQFEQDFTVELKPGEKESYEFTVSNNGETAVVVRSKLEMEGNLPLTFSCGPKDGDSREVGELEWEDSQPLECQDSREYQVNVSWDDGEKGYQYANGVAILRLTVVVRQAD